MDIVVADIPPKYGIILSRSWGAKIQGTLHIDMTYATIPVFSQPRRLYTETHMKYMVSSQEKPDNSPIYSIHTELDSFIIYNDENINEQGEGDDTPIIGKDGRKEKNLKQFANLEHHNKHDEDHRQQTNHPHKADHGKQDQTQHNENLEEQSKNEQSAKPKKQHSDSHNKQDKEDKNKFNKKSEVEPLQSMSFDGSCNKTSSGAGIWVHNTEK